MTNPMWIRDNVKVVPFSLFVEEIVLAILNDILYNYLAYIMSYARGAVVYSDLIKEVSLCVIIGRIKTGRW